MPIGFRATGIDVLTGQSRKLPVIDRPRALRFVLKVLIAYGGLSPGSMVDGDAREERTVGFHRWKVETFRSAWHAYPRSPANAPFVTNLTG